MPFLNRSEAGQILAKLLTAYQDRPDVLVLALPRGGVPVAFEIARALHAPLDVFLVRKLGVPGQEELAMGAIATGGVEVINEHVVEALAIPDSVIAAVANAEQRELDRREQSYRGERPALDVRRHTVILVDDGLATGTTMRAAIAALRQQQPARIIAAVPVAAFEAYDSLRAIVDEMVCAETPEEFQALSIWYEDFAQTTDAEVRTLLERAARENPVMARES